LKTYRRVNLQPSPPRVPAWIRKFACPSWTNVFHLCPNTQSLYPITLRAEWKSQFNDWSGKTLLLAKDGCPPEIIHKRIARGEPQPWRYGERERGDEMGWRTNDRLFGFASRIPGGKLYGSAAANMLYNEPGSSRELKGFTSEPLQRFLQRVLCWVFASMPKVQWVACLGKESWLLTCSVLGDHHAANQFQTWRDSQRSVVGWINGKSITAFPLYHPGALGNAINNMELGWLAFGRLVSGPKQLPNSNIRIESEPPRPITSTDPTFKVAPTAATHSRIVTATLTPRVCRIRFVLNGQGVHTGPQYNSGNTWAKIIAFARSKRGGAPANLPRYAQAVPQVFIENEWIDVQE
jgi:hypothetical protein